MVIPDCGIVICCVVFPLLDKLTAPEDAMVQPVQWRRPPKPDERVVKLTHAADEAAQRGEVRLAGVVLITPTLEVECEVAGDLDSVKRDLLIGGLVRLIRKISE